jgi:hypothetical protein
MALPELSSLPPLPEFQQSPVLRQIPRWSRGINAPTTHRGKSGYLGKQALVFSSSAIASSSVYHLGLAPCIDIFEMSYMGVASICHSPFNQQVHGVIGMNMDCLIAHMVPFCKHEGIANSWECALACRVTPPCFSQGHRKGFPCYWLDLNTHRIRPALPPTRDIENRRSPG